MRKTISYAMLAVLLTGAPASAQKAVVRDGHPAVECDNQAGYIWSIGRVDFKGKPAFSIPVYPMGPGHNDTFFVTVDRIVFQDAKKPTDSFDESRTAITWKLEGMWMRVSVAGRKSFRYPFSAGTLDGEHRAGCCLVERFPGCLQLVQLAFTDFAAAERQFNQLTRLLPPVQEAAWREFQPKATAWRLLPTKPPLSPEAERQRILAENAVREKDFDSAVDHFESALEVQPMWPEGWFNLALIYAEQNNYADATDRMKHYLEFVPDAPDAKDARTQMIIWEGKAKH